MSPVTPVTDIHESPISRWLFTDCPVRYSYWRQLNLPIPARIGFELQPPVVIDVCAPGDVDVLVSNPEFPERAVAFECKRIKVKPETFETIQPGKMQDLKKGVRQANGLLELGFHQSYLFVCVQIDGRERHEYNFAGRGLSGPLVKAIYDSLKGLELLPSVGLLAAEVMQPVEKPIEDAGGVGIKVVRLASQQTQPNAVTEWVRLHMAK
jgi:hypothetical protein